jgi:hypothetical protein
MKKEVRKMVRRGDLKISADKKGFRVAVPKKEK